MRKILITGATGFIGTHLVSRLLNESFELSVFVRDREKLDPYIREKVRVFTGDILDEEKIRTIPADIDTVVHLAACFRDNIMKKNDNDMVYRVNVEGTRNIVEILSRGKLKHFIFSSSISVYDGLETTERIDETTEPRPDNVYGRSKLEAEKIVREAADRKGFKTTVLRPPFVYGPGNKRNIYRMIEAVDRGWFCFVGRGDNIRSAVYVGNLVQAVMLVLDDQRTRGGVYIVTDNKDYTLKEIHSAIARILRKKGSKIFIPLKLGKFCARGLDIVERFTGRKMIFDSDDLKKFTRAFIFSCDKFCGEFGYLPESDFYSTIEETVNWYIDLKKKKGRK